MKIVSFVHSVPGIPLSQTDTTTVSLPKNERITDVRVDTRRIDIEHPIGRRFDGNDLSKERRAVRIVITVPDRIGYCRTLAQFDKLIEGYRRIIDR
ncbi:MAG: hypothetical protein MZV63_60255 [Marinilabiliales bacterium]|nr:hypothetical protein [Marinilabiliales bacterium]